MMIVKGFWIFFIVAAVMKWWGVGHFDSGLGRAEAFFGRLLHNVCE